MNHIEAVILDWAGTTLDFGCMAPVEAFRSVFENEGVSISVAEARKPMGAHKRDHIAAICEQEGVRNRWFVQQGAHPDDIDVERMFQAFIPMQMKILPTYSKLIPGTLETVRKLKEWNMKIGSTTGFTRPMMELLLAKADKQGYRPHSSVAATDVPKGRPYPFMCLTNAINLGVSSVQSCVKVDDTIPGIQEGLNAGMWTVGISASGNEVGMTLEDFQSLDSKRRTNLVWLANKRMTDSGAHYVVETIADLLPVIEEIDKRVQKGDRP